jgi:hypothetical protein
MRIVQQGTDPDIIVFFLVGTHIDAALRGALGVGPSIVAFSDPRGVPLEHIFSAVGATRMRSIVFGGFSAGCMGVRAALLGTDLSTLAERWGVVCIDGTHASLPPEPWQLAVWRDVGAAARESKALAVFTCTQNIYVESDLPKDTRFSATVSVLRASLGLALETPDAEHHEGDLHVHAFPSAHIDHDAHVAQQRVVLPAMLERYVRPWLVRGAQADDTRPDGTAPLPVPELSADERAMASSAVAVVLDGLARDLD